MGLNKQGSRIAYLRLSEYVSMVTLLIIALVTTIHGPLYRNKFPSSLWALRCRV